MKATNEELTEAVVRLSNIVAGLIEMNASLHKKLLPFSEELSDDQKQELIVELDDAPHLAMLLRESVARYRQDGDDARQESQLASNGMTDENAQHALNTLATILPWLGKLQASEIAMMRVFSELAEHFTPEQSAIIAQYPEYRDETFNRVLVSLKGQFPWLDAGVNNPPQS